MNAAHIKHEEQMARLLPPCTRSPTPVVVHETTSHHALASYQPQSFAVESQNALLASVTDGDKAEACQKVLCFLQDIDKWKLHRQAFEELHIQFALMDRIERVSVECCAERLARESRK